ncbi:fibronectin type III domain-containing protein [Candidatus Uhrbacteria bacterium]|nr:fibronectin type III domain-containing protein [Candidatus Uhrbacteria bacterium]
MRIFQRTFRTLAIAAVVITAVMVGVWPSFAATLTSANDYPSTLQVSQSANHTVLFTTPTGISEGSTITLTFASAFDTSLLSEDDVDIADDGVDLTTAETCSGSEKASITAASDVVTITICGGDGGAIAATSVVSIEMGTHASSSGTGVDQVTNPSSTGNYYIAIGGTFADSGSIILPIGGDDTFAVTATVPSSGGGGESGSGDSGGGAAADTTAPSISNIVVSEVTGSSATVTWSTSEAATRLLDYGLTAGFEVGTSSVSGYYTSHSVALSGLSEGETYYFQIRAADSDGNMATFSTQTFTTADETDPVISDIDVVDITTTSARVTWETDEASDSTVAYGLTTAYEETESEEDLDTSHSILLTDLTAGTTYHFQVLSTDASTNQAFSSDQTFETNEDDAPGNVSNLSVVSGDGSVTLTWTSPSDDDLSGMYVLQCLDGYPTDPTDDTCEVVSTQLTSSLAFSGLSNGITYYFGVFAYDEAGQFASGALVLGTPQASEEEVPSEEESSQAEETSEEETSEEESGGEVELPTTQTEETSAEETTSPGSAVSCGDSVCSATESSRSCPTDCEQSEEPTSLDAEDGILSDADVLFLVADETIALETMSSGVVEVTPTSDMRILVPADAVSDDVETMLLTVGDDTYLMRLDDALALYLADVTIPDMQTVLEVSVLVTYLDGSSDAVSSYLRVVAPGYVYQVIDGEEAAVPNAHVTLFELVEGEFVVWDGSPYGQFNPSYTSADGAFAWYVSNGTYRVSVEADGYESAQSAVLTIQNAIINPRILLTAVGQEEGEEEVVVTEPSQEEVEEETAPQQEAPSTLVETFFHVLPFKEVQQTLEAIRELPGVEEAAEVSTPVLAITAGVSVVVLSVAFDFLPFLQYLFTAPVLFFWRRRRKGYGVVYNAIAKTAIDLAVVRLFKIEDGAADARGRLVKSRVTDRGGRYFFLVQPGTYRITVTKPGFQFPTDYLKGEKTDGSYLDVYHGEMVVVTADNAVITANIPLDPSQESKYHAPNSVRRRRLLRVVQQSVAITGVLMAILFAIIRPTFLSVGMVVVQVVVYVLARRLSKPHKPISWGIVYNKETGRPIAQAVARVFEPKYNKLLETQVTDSKGRFAFMLGPNQYYATFEKQGFKQTQIDPIDYSGAEEPKGFSEEVPLEPQQDPQSPS